MRNTRSFVPGFLACCALACAVSLPVLAGFEELRSFDAHQLLVQNLIGRIDIEGHAGSRFEVEVRVQGRDASPERIRLDTNDGDYAELIVEFPLDESRRFVYPDLDRREVRFDPRDHRGDGWLSRLFGGGRRIEVSDTGRGLEVWADVKIKVPRGGTLKLEHGAGRVRAAEVEGSLNLFCQAGSVEVSGVTGRLVADTGSGSISIQNVYGAILADSGSGAVSLNRCAGGEVVVDTGSGRVELEFVETPRLSVDTGSGRVVARGIGADEVNIDTGSGSVLLELDRMGRGRFAVDTGSGSIEVRLPADASVEVIAETGAGGIDVDLDNYELLHKDRDEAELRIGDGAARMSLDTGSGTIRIRQGS